MGCRNALTRLALVCSLWKPIAHGALLFRNIDVVWHFREAESLVQILDKYPSSYETLTTFSALAFDKTEEMERPSGAKFKESRLQGVTPNAIRWDPFASLVHLVERFTRLRRLSLQGYGDIWF